VTAPTPLFRVCGDLQLNPGARAAEIAARLDLPPGRVSEILTRLKRTERVETRAIPKFQRRKWARGWWLTGDERPRLALPFETASPSVRRAARGDLREQAVFALLEASPGLFGLEIQQRCNFTRGVRHLCLRELFSEGLLLRDKEPHRGYAWRLTPDPEP